MNLFIYYWTEAKQDKNFSSPCKEVPKGQMARIRDLPLLDCKGGQRENQAFFMDMLFPDAGWG